VINLKTAKAILLVEARFGLEQAIHDVLSNPRAYLARAPACILTYS